MASLHLGELVHTKRESVEMLPTEKLQSDQTLQASEQLDAELRLTSVVN